MKSSIMRSVQWEASALPRLSPRPRSAALSLTLLAAILLATTATAADSAEALSTPAPTVISPAAGVAFQQKLNVQVPLEIPFLDETGAAVRLGDYFGQKPVVLNLVYFQCPMLCNLTRDGLVRALQEISLEPGRDFIVLTVSFDPREKPALAAAARQTMLHRYGRPGAEAGWHFLTGTEESIRRLTDAVGFRYRFDKQSGNFAHPAGIVVLTPGGRVSRYFQGVEYPSRDLRLGLVEASANHIGTLTDQVLLLCFQYDPATGRYGPVIFRSLRISGLAAFLALVGGIGWMLHRDRRRRKQAAPAGGQADGSP